MNVRSWWRPSSAQASRTPSAPVTHAARSIATGFAAPARSDVAGVADPGRCAATRSRRAPAAVRPESRQRAPSPRSITRLWPVAALCLALTPPALAAPPDHLLLLDGAVTGGAIVAVGERGVIFRSADSGHSWSTSTSPTAATLTGIVFAPDGRHGWAVGHDAIILATTDGGRSWSKQWQDSNLENSFLDVCTIDAAHVIAVGAYGLFVETHDGGRSWVKRTILDGDMHLNRLTRGPTGTLYLAGERGTLLRSRDAGATWVHIESPYDGSFYGILPLDAHTLIAHGLRGRIFRSENDGDTWAPVPLDEPLLVATAARTRDGTLILAGQPRGLWRSRGGGRTFARWTPGFDDAVAELVVAPDGAVIALGEDGATRLAPAP